MDFEFDPAKSKSNHEKHGIDFVEAQQLWEDEDRLEIPARTEDEPRYVLIAALDQKLWLAFFTYRKGRIRLISVRRARREERELYYESQESREDV
ncbi:MAG: BrnT family toxin [Nitrospira sp.]|nr:BrnT family toxin [Nitrospira sp.]